MSDGGGEEAEGTKVVGEAGEAVGLRMDCVQFRNIPQEKRPRGVVFSFVWWLLRLITSAAGGVMKSEQIQ